jgi:ribosomal protein L13E
MQIERSFPSEQRNMHAYLGQERAGEGFAVGEVRVAQPDMLVARETPAGQPVARSTQNA